MNKSELIAALAQEVSMPKTEAGKTLNALIKIIGDTLQKNESIVVLGFGSFSVKDCPARMGHNPSTGAKIKIAAKKVVKFRPGAGLEIANKPAAKVAKAKKL